jgi:uncharacterized ferritin-like protein (DUF455 family)
MLARVLSRTARARVIARATKKQQRASSRSTWDGLEAWRGRGSDEKRRWAEDKNEPSEDERASTNARTSTSTSTCLATMARRVVMTADPREKARLAHEAYEAVLAGEAAVASDGFVGARAEMPRRPARPEKPRLVPPKDVPSPKNSPLGAVAHVMHNVAHIELNAIDLAMDTVARFASLRGALPDQFFIDFAHVADDESRHLLWCLQRLEELGVEYGDMVAHDVLWEGAEATAEDPLARLAVVPCMQEARGLDAGPRLVERLVGHGDNRSASIIRRISDEEVGHVAVGAAWFRTVCEVLRDVDAETSGEDVAAATFRSYIRRLAPDALRGPFNVEDRARAGIDPSWFTDDVASSVPVERHTYAIDVDAARALRDRLSNLVEIEQRAAHH